MAEWGAVLDGEFYARDAHELARALLGCVVVSTVDGVLTAGRLVELEVYGGVDDPACHADRGVPTDRTRAMFGPPGTAYVYRIYGMYDCLNVVAPRGPENKASAILVRAIEPLVAIGTMLERRGITDVGNLTSGPGKLCQALAVTRALDGHVLSEAPLQFHEGEFVAPERIATSGRIGLNEKTCRASTHFLWRYTVRGNAHLSR